MRCDLFGWIGGTPDALKRRNAVAAGHRRNGGDQSENGKCTKHGNVLSGKCRANERAAILLEEMRSRAWPEMDGAEVDQRARSVKGPERRAGLNDFMNPPAVVFRMPQCGQMCRRGAIRPGPHYPDLASIVSLMLTDAMRRLPFGAVFRGRTHAWTRPVSARHAV